MDRPSSDPSEGSPRVVASATANPFLAEAAQQPYDRDYGSPRSEREPVKPFGIDQVHLDAFWIPALWIRVDEKESGPTSTERADLDTGTGFGVRAGVGTDQQSIGLMYVASYHDEDTTDSNASTQALYLDFEYRAPIAVRSVMFEVGGGFGAAWLEFGRLFDNDVEGAFTLHGMLRFNITDNIALTTGMGGFLFGHFGDTVAYGTWLMAGAGLSF
jgi:hypothetical protein